MTRTWYSLPSEDLLAVAGLWRATAEWGDAYSMVMVDGNEQMAKVHDRMPVILMRNQWAQWVDGSADDAFALCKPWQGELTVDHTATPWAAAKAKLNELLIYPWLWDRALPLHTA